MIRTDFYCIDFAAINSYGFFSIDDYCQSQPEMQEILEFQSLDGEILVEKRKPLKRILQGENLGGLVVRVRNILKGWEKVLSYSGTFIKDTNDKPLMIVLIIQDITEKKNEQIKLRFENN